MSRYKDYSVRVTLDTEDELHRELEELAARDGVSVEMLVESLVCVGVYGELKRKVDVYNRKG